MATLRRTLPGDNVELSGPPDHEHSGAGSTKGTASRQCGPGLAVCGFLLRLYVFSNGGRAHPGSLEPALGLCVGGVVVVCGVRAHRSGEWVHRATDLPPCARRSGVGQLAGGDACGGAAAGATRAGARQRYLYQWHERRRPRGSGLDSGYLRIFWMALGIRAHRLSGCSLDLRMDPHNAGSEVGAGLARAWAASSNGSRRPTGNFRRHYEESSLPIRPGCRGAGQSLPLLQRELAADLFRSAARS